MPPLTSDPGRGPARTALTGALVAGAVVFVVVVVAVARSPGGGVLGGIALGAFAGLLVAAGGAWAAMTLARPAPPPEDSARGNLLAKELATVLAELEAARLQFVADAARLATWRIPLGIVAGAAFWVLTEFGDEPGGIFDLLIKLGVGGAGGYFWATAALSARYRRLYKDRVLPRLAARFGAIEYRAAVLPDLGALREANILPDYNDASAEDELFGTYRGLPVSILELTLHIGSGKHRRQNFRGLIAELTLPRGLSGTTTIVDDAGAFGALDSWLEGGGRSRVRLEDPAFEAEFEVYGTDQIGARALLTPAFMERFMAFAARPGFGKPAALAQGNRLTLALPRNGGALFEPPGFRQPAASRAALVELHDDIAAVLATADAVIDLDHAARGVAAQA